MSTTGILSLPRTFIALCLVVLVSFDTGVADPQSVEAQRDDGGEIEQ